MKKLFCVLLSMILVMSLFAGCAASGKSDSGAIKVAIVQQLDHSSLDEIRLAVEAELERLAKEKNMTITYTEFNGRNDATILNQIGAQVVSDGYDVIIPIATMAAQCMVTAAEGKDIPIIYAAISDPVSAGHRHRHLRRSEYRFHAGYDAGGPA